MISPMIGASATQDGAQGLVPTPLAGDQTKYLRGDGTWQNPTATLQTVVDNLIGSDTGKSVRTIAQEETALIVNNAPAAFDTLKEIADWISGNHDAADIIALDNRVDDLEEAVFGADGTSTTDGLVFDVSTLQTNYTNLQTTVTNIDRAVRWQDMVEE